MVSKQQPRELIRVSERVAAATSPLWHEALFGIEILLLHASPIYYGFDVPGGDGSAVIVIPGFLGSDIYLVELYAWLRRMGYLPYFSGIGLNNDCPNLLIRRRLQETVTRARRETRRKVHLLGHSLGGLLARAAAAERPADVASVITLGSPFKGAVVHPRLQRAVDAVRRQILETRGEHVLPQCYTGRCTCSFIGCLRQDFPESIRQTAVYTRTDSLVDWHYCVTGNPDHDIEVTGTHIGLAFNPNVYRIIAERLAASRKRR